VAWSRGDLGLAEGGFAVPASDRLAGRIVGELAGAAVGTCTTGSGASPEPTP